jgi:hypothetical protein
MSELWDVYLQPTDATNLEECKQVDKYNESVWMKNNQNLPKINELLTKMGIPAYRLIAAPKYYPSAYNAWRKSINDPSTKTLHATQYLFKHTAVPRLPAAGRGRARGRARREGVHPPAVRRRPNRRNANTWHSTCKQLHMQ